MTTPQETNSNKYLFWGIQTLFGLIITIGAYTYTSNLTAQAEFNKQTDTKILKLQEQVIELLQNDAGTKQLLKQIQEDVTENKQTIKERFDKLEDKIDKIK